MRRHTKNLDRAGMIGGVSGLLAFLAVGAAPAIILGGSVGAMVAAMVRGTAVGSAFLVRVLILGGMGLGAACAATVFVMGGMPCAMVVQKLLEDTSAPRPVHRPATPLTHDV